MSLRIIAALFAIIGCRKEPPKPKHDLADFIARSQLEYPPEPAPQPKHPIDVTRPDIGEPPDDMATIPGLPPEQGRFYLDKTEVSIAAYQECATAGVCRSLDELSCAMSDTLKSGPTYPMTCVIGQDVLAYCHFRGKRVPTDREWMRAAIGNGKKYPWGDAAPSCKRAALGSCNAYRPSPTGSRPGDISREGVRDLGGNVAELVRFTDPYDGKIEGWGAAGGSITTPFKDLAAALRKLDFNIPGGDIGFRCARDPT